MFVALAIALALLQAVPAPTKPLFDRKPATIDGVRYEREKVFEGDYVSGLHASDFDPIGPARGMFLQGWSGGEGSFHIRFVGRRTAKASTYGESRTRRHAVLITDMINARPNSDPSPE